jgi:hypothetical protein
MHKYLRAAGFSDLNKRADFDSLVQKIAVEADSRAYTSLNDDTMIAVFSKEFAPGVGITVCGEFNENNQFFYEYAYPYVKSNLISSYESISVERHAAKESYAGVYDDSKIGVTIIFYLQNIIPYIRAKNTGQLPIKGTSVMLSALSVQGTIVMPLAKNAHKKAKAVKAGNERTKLIEAARQGNEEALESLTLDDMDTYTAISKKIQKEDVFTIVDTSFMPYGVECDQYAILGEITSVDTVTNTLTGEQLYKLQMECNGIVLELCINSKDLYGEPRIGRRFKGYIWLQGYINYPTE